MAGEIQFSAPSAITAYFIVLNRLGQVWNTSGGTGAFQTWTSAVYDQYDIAATEQGTASHLYTGTFPAAIPAGTYGINARQQITGTVLETDPTIAAGNFEWNGTVTMPLSDMATSGQVGQIVPLRLARGCQVSPFKFYLKSSADHITPFTSGVCSGQIKRDTDVSFTALQSGAFVEEGLGFYRVQALTSGDLLCNAAALLFTANGISGGSSDPCPMVLITQRTSGQ